MSLPTLRGRPPNQPNPVGRGLVFRRYANRRYYSVEQRSYVPCEALLTRRKVVVIDASTGRDITRWARAAARLERGRRELDALARRMGLEP